MANNLLSVEEAEVRIGGKPFFEDLSFHIHDGAQIALVGRNGAGKTTLMNVITGDKDIDEGRRFVYPGISIGYMQQHVTPEPGQSVRDFVFEGLQTASEADQTYKIEKILTPLEVESDADMAMLSGGQLRRAALARSLVEDPDILLLDEPTNHLDLEIIQWLETYLKNRRGAMVCVSHDRYFLANVTNKIFWLDRGQLRVAPKGFAYFDEWAGEILDQERRELENREKKVAQEMEWASKGMKARVKRNQRRLQQAYEAQEKLEKDKAAYRRVTSTIELPTPKSADSARIVTEFINVHKAFTDAETGLYIPILKHFNMRVMRGDRIGIIGRNGTGKTTFLKMLIGNEIPDQGKIKRADHLAISYFDQRRSDLDESKTVKQNMCPNQSDYISVRGKDKHICGYLKDFLFDPHDAWRPVHTLSGGQKNRLMLAKVLADPGSLLILDEPTNDLDMDTLDMLEKVLNEYDGTLILVSHDRDFLDRCVGKLLAFEGQGHVEGIVGGYSDYLRFCRARDKSDAQERDAGSPAAKGKTGSGGKAGAQPSQSGIVKGGKMSYKLKRELEQLPGRIEKLQNEITELQQALGDPDLYLQDPQAFYKKTERLEAVRAELETCETRWLELEELRQQAGEA